MNLSIDPKWGAYLGLAVIIEQGIGHGTVSLTNLIPVDWAPYVTSWANFLAFVGTSIMTYQAAVSSPAPGPLVGAPPSLNAVAKVLLIAFLPLALLAVSQPAHAETRFQKIRPPALTGDPLADAKTDLQNLGLIPVQGAAAGVTKNSDGSVTCSFNIFANLNPKNLQATIQACISDANSTFEPDVAAALASAQAYSGSGDQTAIQCLQPALAIVQAGIERAAVAAVAAQPATATSPAVAAVAAAPGYKPGIITLFQKFREFTLAGGPTACQNWVQGTITGAAAPVAGAVAGAAGAAALGGL
jgi:hypothetical protein